MKKFKEEMDLHMILLVIVLLAAIMLSASAMNYLFSL